MLSKHPAFSNCLLRGQGKMAYCLAQRSEGRESESQPRPTSVLSRISQNIEISLCISHSETLCDWHYPPDPLDLESHPGPNSVVFKSSQKMSEK